MTRRALRQRVGWILTWGLGWGLVGGLLIALLEWTEYRFVVVEHSVEIYGALVAVLFAGLGIWLGSRRTGRRAVAEVPVAPVAVAAGAEPAGAADFVADEQQREALAITPREMETLRLVAEGLSNREIAERLFVSENTVKTHCSRAFGKLGAQRRTQAVQRAKVLGLLP